MIDIHHVYNTDSAIFATDLHGLLKSLQEKNTIIDIKYSTALFGETNADDAVEYSALIIYKSK